MADTPDHEPSPGALPATDPVVGELIADFVREAMINGWLTLGPADDVIPPGLQDALSGHQALGLTEEGRQHLTALGEQLKSRGLDAPHLDIDQLFR